VKFIDWPHVESDMGAWDQWATEGKVSMEKFLGKKPARHGAVKFQANHFINFPSIQVPKYFGHVSNAITWGVLGNDQAGNCVWAGAAHEHIDYANGVKHPKPIFTAENILAQYSKFTGYDPTKTDANGNNPTDQGTDMVEAAKYRQKTGLLDASGKRHFIKAYAALPVGNVDTLIRANYMFGAIGIGVQLPQSAMDQFDEGKVWDVPSQKTDILGGHYVSAVGMNSKGYIMVVTWGDLQAVTPAFIERYMDEGLVYFSEEYLMDNVKVSPENFDAIALNKALSLLSGSRL
jgi:hypothetical protein